MYIQTRAHYTIRLYMKWVIFGLTIYRLQLKAENFIIEVFEIAFGDEAHEKDYSSTEVIAKLREMSENSWKYEELDV